MENWFFFDADGNRLDKLDDAKYIYIKDDLAQFQEIFDDYEIEEVRKLNILYIWDAWEDIYKEYKPNKIALKILNQMIF